MHDYLHLRNQLIFYLEQEMSETSQNSEIFETQTVKSVKRNLLQRIFGICATKPPQDANCWKLVDKEIEIDLSRAEELSHSGRGIRLEGGNLPVRVLIFKDDDDLYYAFQNRCTHGGRRLDPVPEGKTVQCCSVGRSTFDYNGKLLSGSARESIKILPVSIKEGIIVINVG